MKKIGIITLFDVNNYGNRLQNFATQELIHSLGCKAVSYVERKKRVKPDYGSDVKYLIHLCTGFWLSSSPEGWKNYLLIRRRKRNFLKFQKRISFSYISSLKGLDEKADFFVAGSDQIWQPKWWSCQDKDMYLLTFARPEQKLCISPSFGVNSLSEEYKDVFRTALSSFSLLAARENAGASIIKDLTGREAEVTIDPTLAIDAQRWRKVSKKPKVNTASPYVLTYFLGGITELACQDIVQLLSENSKLNVLHMNEKTSPKIYECGPAEFLYLIDHAEIVLTDSFHASVFSLLFSRPFLVYERFVTENDPAMSSRLDTLLSTFGLERKWRKSNEKTEWFDCNYDSANLRLSQEREKLRNLLVKGFGLSKE